MEAKNLATAASAEKSSEEEASAESSLKSQQSTTARSWFENLSPEECAAALSFQDGPLLASFLTLASSSSSSRSSSHSLMVDGAQNPAFKLDWTMATDLKKVEATLSTYQKQFQDGSTKLELPEVSTPVAAVKEEAAAAAASPTDDDDPTTPTEEKESPKPMDPDELRIRSSGGNDPSKDPATTSLQPIPATTTTESTITASEHSKPELDSEPTTELKEIASDDVKPATSETSIVKTEPETEKAEPVDKANGMEEAEKSNTDATISAPAKVDNDNSNNNSNKESSEEKAEAKEEIMPVEKAPVVATANENEKPAITLPPAGEEMAESLCAVFPSAANSSSGCIPFVTLTPAFVKQKGTGDIVKALDSVLQVFSPSTLFLSPDFLPVEWLDGGGELPSEDQMYLHRLRSVLGAAAANDDDDDDDDDDYKSSPVLLFLLLLIRIEVAVFVAFRNQTTAVETSGEASEAPRAEKDRRISSETLSGLLSRGETLGDLSKTINAEQLKDIMVPLVDAGFCSFSEDAADDANTVSDAPRLNNLLFTPLQILVQTLSNYKESNRPSFEKWEDAWKATLGNVDKHANATEPAKDETDVASVSLAAEEQPPTSGNVLKSSNETTPTTPTVDDIVQSNSSDWMDENGPAVVTPHPPSSSKKSKKKKNKRKKKKNSNSHADSSVQNNSRSQATQTEVDIVETEENDVATPDEKSEQKEKESHPGKTDEVDAAEKLNEPEELLKASEAVKDGDPAEPPKLETNTPAARAPQSEIAETVEAAESKDEDAEVAQNSSFDSEKNAMSTSEDTASTKSESTKPEENEAVEEAKAGGKSDFSVSRVHGVGTVVVAPSALEEPSQLSSTNSSNEGESKNHEDSSAADDNPDEWETVEVKARGSRKKGSQTGRSSQNGAKKSKSTRTSASRKRIAHRKIVKEILSSVLDSVDEEVKARQQQKARAAKSSTPSTPAWQSARAIGQASGAKKEVAASTLRDVVVGTQAESAPKKAPQPAAPKSAPAKQPVSSGPLKPAEKGKSASSPGKRGKGQATGADQNTASTVPETVSAVSDARRIQPNNSDRDVTRSESSSGGDSDDLQKQDRASKPVNSSKDASPAPPLPTLLSAGNANSSSSSVASSLEAPHASHGHHHTSPANENDVGYHLLDVCNRLSRDMDVFMARRAAALDTRRNERRALLAALQDSVSSLWNGHSHVELYGSCATMLDLPSSDLDVVVLGLDHMQTAMAPSSPQKNAANGSSGDEESPDTTGADVPLPHHHSMPPHYVPVHLNAERVVRLAAELERHPWAVHVKAIPTATVPVVKVLADPSRLPGMAPLVVGKEFVPQNQQMATPTASAQVASAPSSDQSQSPAGGSQPGVYQPEMPQPVWRGADVINGLLSLDITFEGPEHGGIGSTEFSARVVHDVCNETGLVAESTPFVQVIMVVKELLAQRRLNEPFSGGLSSYALLLLVLAVVCERKVICEELERVERQRRVVAAGVGNNGFSSVSGNDKLSPGNRGVPATSNAAGGPGKKAAPIGDGKKKGTGAQQASNQPSKKNDKRAQTGNTQNQGNNAPQKAAASQPGQKAPQATSTLQKDHAQQNSQQAPAKKPSGGSWACIAKGSKTDSSATQKGKTGSEAKDQAEQKKAEPKKPSSFADAVARSQAKPPANGQASVPRKPSGAAQAKTANAANAKKTNKKQPTQPAAKPGQANKNERVKTTTQDTPKTGDKGSSGGAAQKDGATVNIGKKNQSQTPRKIEADEETSKFNNYSSGVSNDPSLSGKQSLFPQGFNDVIEVLCSGETTPGKLLMHFLLFYGQHFDAHATAIDISGKHHRDISMQNPPYTYLSPYIQRRTAGTIDPVTGMLTVDPIVVYDPLEGAENNNVARRCFLWSSVKWVFAQSYMTLSSAVEQNTTPPTTPGSKSEASAPANNQIANQGQREAGNAAWKGPYNPTDTGNLFDPSSPHPLLELLLSY